jgi:hypothetical protein
VTRRLNALVGGDDHSVDDDERRPGGRTVLDWDVEGLDDVPVGIGKQVEVEVVGVRERPVTLDVVGRESVDVDARLSVGIDGVVELFGLIVITVAIYRYDRTQSCGRPGTDRQ